MGTDIPDEYLAKGMLQNDDGWGLVVRDPEDKKIVLVKRSFSWNLAFKYWNRYRDYERVFHARAASPGTIVDHNNLHPFRMKSPTGEDRYFFHNGRVNSLPTVNNRYCDSWHVARYFSTFATTQQFDEALEDLAHREDSRFALVRPEGVSRYGLGWCLHKGVFYSNPGIFAEKVEKYANGGKNVYAGLDKFDEEFISDKSWSYVGMEFDKERKVYTNKFVVKAIETVYDYDYEPEWDWRAATSQRKNKHIQEKPKVSIVSSKALVTVSDSDWVKLFAEIPGAAGCYQSRTTHTMAGDDRPYVAVFTASRIWLCAVPTEYLGNTAFLRYAVRRREGLTHVGAVTSGKAAGFEPPEIKYFRKEGVYNLRGDSEAQEAFESTMSEQVRQAADKAEKRLADVRNALGDESHSELGGREIKWALEDGTIEVLTLSNWRKRLEFWTTELIRKGNDDDAIEDYREEHMRQLLILNPNLSVADMFDDLITKPVDVQC